jgi:hypothetical protein
MVAFFETLIFWRVSGAAPAKLGKRGVVLAEREAGEVEREGFKNFELPAECC